MIKFEKEKKVNILTVTLFVKCHFCKEMSSHQQLFYNKNYTKIIQDLSSNQDLSVQETHNLTICKYLQNGDSPLQDLIKLADNIRQDTSSNQWPANPSWPLVLYHIALYSMKFCAYTKTENILTDIWNNYDKQDKLLMLSITVLTIELACRSNLTSNLEKAMNFIKATFPTQESIQAVVQTKNIDPNIIAYYTETILNAKFRIDVVQLLREKVSPKTREQYQKLMQGLDISEAAKHNPKLSPFKGIPLSCLAYHFGEFEKSNSILETIAHPVNFAVYNNRGLFELIKGHYNSALLHFSRALNSRTNNHLTYPYHQIAYNLGISLLQKRKPRRAFKYLHSVIPLMRNSPYLWLRLSECIVMYYKQRIAKARQRTQFSPIVAQKLCTSSQTYYLLPATDSRLFELDQKKNPEMTLEFGITCARNCIQLCNANQSDIANRARMLCSFICLETGDGKMASEMCGPILSANTTDRHQQQQQYLAKIYSLQGIMLSGDYEAASRAMSRMILESSLTKEKELNTLNYLTFARVHMCGDKDGQKSTDIKNADNMLAKAAEADPRKPETVLTSILFNIMRKHMAHAAQEIKDYAEGSEKASSDDN